MNVYGDDITDDELLGWSEKTYRRGFQHGVVYAEKMLKEMITKLSKQELAVIKRCLTAACEFRHAKFTLDNCEWSPLDPETRHYKHYHTMRQRHLEIDHPHVLECEE